MAGHQAVNGLGIDSGFGLADPPPSKLAVRGISLTLGTRVVLDDLYFEIRPGEVLGILGPNGSGKTSLMRCITGLWKPDRGTLWLDGDALGPLERSLRVVMGVVFQEPSLDNRLSAIENLMLVGRLFGLRGKEATRRARDLLEFMELGERADEKTSKFSGGMRRRLELASALIHNPQILLLDEPTVGLDPAALDRTWQRILAIRDLQGLSVLVSTHRAEEASRCDRLIVMDRGHILCTETPAQLMNNVAGDVICMRADDTDYVQEGLAKMFDASTRVVDGVVEWERPEAHLWIPRIVEAFPPRLFESLSVRKPTLADAFYHLTGHSLAGEGELS